MGILCTKRARGLSRLGSKFVATIALSVIAGVTAAEAQVVSINTGVEEYYDSNIFLEDDRPIDPALLANVPAETVDQIITPENDGDPNSSFITHPYIEFEGNLPKSSSLSQYTDISSKVGFGAFIFSSESDQNRLSLDSVVTAKTTETLLPKPWKADITSQFISGSESISAAQGSAGEQVETHDAILGIGVESWAIADKTDASVGYQLLRHDYLGNFVLNSNDDDEDANGADYFSNGLSADVTRHMTDKLDLNATSSATIYNFTNIEDNDPTDPAGDDLDRTEYDVGGGFTYAASDKVQVKALAGVAISAFDKSPITREVGVNPNTGEVEQVTTEGDKTLTSLFYNTGVDYTPQAGTILNLAANQSQETDVDGTVVLVRSVALNGTQSLTERLKFIGSARFVQFGEENDSLNDPTDRWELLAQMRYQLFEAAAFSFGYSYITQNAGDQADESLNFSNGDYNVNRAFIRLDVGLAGVTS